MRADRLLSILLILQTQGCLTAKELAAELEVSERTIYRDMDALSSAGVPVYAERGPGGGCFLLESYRTNLTSLTRDEISALFMLSIPTPLVDLGLDHDVKTAYLKLSAALPDLFRQERETSQDRIHLDPSPWFQDKEYIPHLLTINRGISEDRKIDFNYQLAFGAQIKHLVEPYGLVSKETEWYFIFSQTGVISVVRLSDILESQLSEEKFILPAEFDLVEFWKAWCSRRESNIPRFEVQILIKPELLELLKLSRSPLLLDVHESDLATHDGWQKMTLHFESFEKARKQVLSFGSAVEVLSPISLRKSIQDFAHQIMKVYNPEDSSNIQVR
jgi:predicted DNA-binding transcriptional regulator YafY